MAKEINNKLMSLDEKAAPYTRGTRCHPPGVTEYIVRHRMRGVRFGAY